MRNSEFTTDIRNPNEVDPITPIDALYSDGSNFEVTPDPESTPVRAVASAEEVRVYRINPDGKRHHILTEPSWTPETDTFCQTHANTTECVVEAHDALLYQVFQPKNPPERPTDPPISDKVKDVTETAADLAGLTILIAVAWAAFMVL